MKNNLSLITLFSVAALLGLYFFGSLPQGYSKNQEIFTEQFLEQANLIKLKMGKEIIVLSKSKEELKFGLENNIYPGQWFVSKPDFAPPSIDSLNKLLSIVSGLKPLHQFNKESDLKSDTNFGLSDSETEIEISTPVKTRVLKLGSVNALSKRRYAQIEGEKQVLLLDDGQIVRLLKLELRELKPLSIPLKNITSFGIESRISKVFKNTNGVFEVPGASNIDPQLVQKYLEQIISLPANKTVDSKITERLLQAKLNINWLDSKGGTRQAQLELYSTEGPSLLLKLSGTASSYEFGPEFGRLLNRSLESFIDRKLLRNVVLEDFFASCSEASIPANCKVNKELVQSIQQTIQQVEVLDVERLPGRLMMAGKPLCRLKLGSSKTLFEVGAKVQGLDESQTESPNVYVSDIGLDHYKGVISGLVAEEFCQTIQKLCKEAQAACAG